MTGSARASDPTRVAFSNRAQSAPSSRWTASAVSVSTARNARNLATVGHHAGSVASSPIRSASVFLRAVSPSTHAIRSAHVNSDIGSRNC